MFNKEWIIGRIFIYSFFLLYENTKVSHFEYYRCLQKKSKVLCDYVLGITSCVSKVRPLDTSSPVRLSPQSNEAQVRHRP